MERLAYQRLIEWKNDKYRKPLILQGARQVGKTYLVRQFAKKEFQNLIYLNFEQNQDAHLIFEKNLDPKNIIFGLELYFETKISIHNTLLFFDEIQACQRALTSLKYFQESNEQYFLIAAGSLLGVSIGKNSSFPVGKVNFLSLFPMNFTEFLMAIDKSHLSDYITQKQDLEQIPEVIHNKLIDQLKLYFYIGGMPEVVQAYIDTHNIEKVRKIQNEILKAYENDFSKYSSKSQSIKNKEIWDSLPSQISKENKKFKYADIKKGARTNMYELSIEWLKNAGIIHQVYLLTAPKLPLNGYFDLQKFKIYLLDIGLLGAKLQLNSAIILQPEKLFQEYNGAMTENYVVMELVQKITSNLCYWSSNGKAEVDFIYTINNHIFPLEIKSGSSRTLKSLRSYFDKYQPNYIFRSSPRNFYKRDEFINIPLYAINNFDKITASLS